MTQPGSETLPNKLVQILSTSDPFWWKTRWMEKVVVMEEVKRARRKQGGSSALADGCYLMKSVWFCYASLRAGLNLTLNSSQNYAIDSFLFRYNKQCIVMLGTVFHYLYVELFSLWLCYSYELLLTASILESGCWHNWLISVTVRLVWIFFSSSTFHYWVTFILGRFGMWKFEWPWFTLFNEQKEG